jgi:hypothetical protein
LRTDEPAGAGYKHKRLFRARLHAGLDGPWCHYLGGLGPGPGCGAGIGVVGGGLGDVGGALGEDGVDGGDCTFTISNRNGIRLDEL